MITFLKANLSSLLASGCDFVMTILLVQWGGVEVVWAAACGTTTGGVINFVVNRQWVFGVQHSKALRQARRYALVWGGNLLLNTGGVYLLATCGGIHYAVSKVVTAVLVAFLYNYPMQKHFVFSNNW